ncbi:MAG: hypothetical protein KGP14_04145 [Betaproteobacteria bacterium]|nr:hypothetical protein [Betaproteobacteria bacterium]
MDNDAVRYTNLFSAMKRIVAGSLLLLSLLGSAGSAWAQTYWRDLPPDQRREMRQQMRDHWQQERDTRREESAPRWRDLPPEDRRRLRDDMREQRGLQEHREFRGGGRGWR